MINIRYHIVSITAIFLALGIGTLLGSTFLDRATVDQLDRNIRNAETRIADTEQANRRLEERDRRAQARDEALIQASGTLLDGHLSDQPVLLVVAPGVDQGTVDTLRLVLGNADADLRGSLVLRDDLASSDGIGDDLVATLDLDGDDPVAARDEVLDLLVEALVAAGRPAAPAGQEGDDDEAPEAGTTTDPAATTAPEDGATTTTGPAATTLPDAGPEVPDGDPGTGGDDPAVDPGTGGDDPADDAAPADGDQPTEPDGRQPEILTALVEADLVDLDPGPAYRDEDPVLERTGYRYVFVSQPGLDRAADALLLALLPATETDPSLPAVVVSATVPEVADGAEGPGPTAVDRIRADADRSGLYDTVDDIDTFLGLSSTVTILGAEEGAAAGHYGQGEGHTALAPAGP